MPRPVDNVGAQPSGFGPTETPKTSLGVFESLNATGAPSQAAGLAAALNVADQRMQRPAMYAEMAQGSAGVSQGESAAAFGNVDPAMEAKVAGYQQGVQRVTAQKQLLAWIDDTKSKLNLPMAQGGYADAPLHNGVDADGKTTPGLPQMLDQSAQQTLGGLEKDPVSAAAIAPMYQSFVNHAIGARLQQEQKNRIDDWSSNNMGLALHAATTGDATFDYDAQFKQGVDLIGDRSVVRHKLVDSLIQAQLAAHKPGLAASFLPKSVTTADGQTINGYAEDPATVAALREADVEATKLQAKDNALRTGLTTATVIKHYDDQAAAGIPPKWDTLVAQYNAGIITRPQMNQIWKNGIGLMPMANANEYVKNILLSGGVWSAHVGDVIPGSNDKHVTAQMFQDQFTDQINSLPQDQRVAAAVHGTSLTHLVYKNLQSVLNNLPLTSETGVNTIRTALEQMGNSDETVKSLYFNNPERLAAANQIEQLHQNKMSDADIATYMKSHDFKAAKETYSKFTQPGVQKYLSSFTVDPSSWLTGKFGSTKVSDLSNGGQVMAQVSQLANVIGQQGYSTDPKAIANEAMTEVMNRSYLVSMAGGHSVLLPRTEGDAPQTGKALQDFATKIPALMKAQGYKGDPSDVRLTTDPYQPGVLQLVDHTMMPVNHDRYSAAGITRDYVMQSHSAEVHAAQKAFQDKWNADQSAAAAASHTLAIMSMGHIK